MKVWNIKNKKTPRDAIYIGRPSKWGNPYTIGKDGDRNEVIEKYEKYLLNNLTLLNDAKIELLGRDLVCFCHPLKCHGDILIKLLSPLNEFFE